MKYLVLKFFLVLSLVSSVHAVELNEGVAQNNLSATTGNSLSFELQVPADATNLSIAISGGSGDADLYVRAGAAPTTSNFDCRPYRYGNNETCQFSSPANTTYYIQLRAYNTFSGVTLIATYDQAQTSTEILSNGQTVNGLSGSSGSSRTYKIELPASSSNLTVAMSGGSGDADLYLKFGSAPSTSSYDCRPYLNGNNETCQIASPQTGTYYILVRGYSAYSNVALTASFEGDTNNGGATWDGYETYYSEAIGKSGQALIDALNEAASRNHNRMSYSQVWDALKYTDEDPNNSNNVILLYTGRSQSKNFTSSGNNDPDAWNREHSWPKSHGFSSSGQWAYTDIHHLRPSDASVNATRGNKDFDNGGSEISEAPGNFTDNDSIEPRDAMKGDLARMMFYLDVRYNGNDASGVPDLKLVNYTGTSGATLGSLCVLLAWHNQDPVSDEEIARHARIVERQGNRNPFVDYPAWANEIWDNSCP